MRFLNLLLALVTIIAVGIAHGSAQVQSPGTSGGLLVFSEIVPSNTSTVAVKATFGQIFGIQAFSNTTTIAYLKLYDATSANTTCGSGTPKVRYLIPANSNGTGFIYPEPNGVSFGTAISACVTTGIADNDTSAPAASSYVINITYK